MKKITKILLLMLVLAMIIPSLVACPNKDKDKNKVEEVTGSGEDRFKGVDFDGENITICMNNNSEAERGSVSTAKYMTGLNEKDNTPNENDTIMTAMKDRNDYVTGKLNLVVNYVYIDDPTTTVADTLRTKMQANDGFCDATANMSVGVMRLMMEGMMRNVNTKERTNYFDFTDDAWYDEMMNVYSLGADMATGKMFVLASDYFIDVVRSLDIMYVNEKRFSELASLGTIEDFYYMVEAGLWTYDKLNSYVGLAYSDSNTALSGKDEDDYLGLIYPGGKETLSRIPVMTMTHSADIDYIANNGSGYEYSDFTNAFTLLIDNVLALQTNKGCLGVGSSGASGPSALRGVFAKNKSLFCLGLKLYDLENSALSGMSICPIPLPKLASTDDYKAFVHNNASVGGIFKQGKFTEVSAFWQYATIRSTETRIKYYQDGLGLKYETGTDTTKMLDIIYNGVTVDMSYTWDDYVERFIIDSNNQQYSSLADIMQISSTQNQNLVSSSWAAYSQQKKNGLAQAINTFNQLQA